MQAPHIRPVHSDDMPALLSMAQALAAHHDDVAQVTLESLARDVLGDAPWLRILIAEQDGMALGYAALCPLAQLQFGMRGMDIHHLFVVPKARGVAVGRALITGAIAAARNLECSYVTVGTHPDNHAAAEVYLACGFDRISAHGPRFRFKL